MLTELTIRKLSPKGKERVEVWDDKLPGFGVRVSASGTKSFVLMYYTAGKKKRLTLGRFPMMTLAEARRRAHEALATVAEGGEPEAKPAVADVGVSFSSAVEMFVAQHCRRHNRASHAQETERVLRTKFVTSWGERPIRSISRADVLRVLDDAVDAGHPSAANHALAAVRKLFSWAVERSLVETSPCTGVSRPAPVMHRDRVLSDDELASVWHGALALAAPFSHIVRLLILTGQRRGEVAGLRWSEVDWLNAVWNIPPARTKNGRQHALPLTPLAIEVLKTVPSVHDELAFPARGNDDATPSGFSKIKRRLDELSGVSDWTLHDLRRTLATQLAGMGVAPHVVERILNHASGTFGGVAGIYNRFQYLPEMRAALGMWADHVGKLASNKA